MLPYGGRVSVPGDANCFVTLNEKDDGSAGFCVMAPGAADEPQINDGICERIWCVVQRSFVFLGAFASSRTSFIFVPCIVWTVLSAFGRIRENFK